MDSRINSMKFEIGDICKSIRTPMLLKILGMAPYTHQKDKLGYLVQRYVTEHGSREDLEEPYVCNMDSVDYGFEKCTPLYIKLFDLETPRVVY